MEKDPVNRISIDGIRVSDDVISYITIIVTCVGTSLDKEEWYLDP